MAQVVESADDPIPEHVQLIKRDERLLPRGPVGAAVKFVFCAPGALRVADDEEAGRGATPQRIGPGLLEAVHSLGSSLANEAGLGTPAEEEQKSYSEYSLCGTQESLHTRPMYRCADVLMTHYSSAVFMLAADATGPVGPATPDLAPPYGTGIMDACKREKPSAGNSNPSVLQPPSVLHPHFPGAIAAMNDVYFTSSGIFVACGWCPSPAPPLLRSPLSHRFSLVA